MNERLKSIDKKYIFLSVILLVAFCVYAVAATQSSLWFDEAVEYFYSKYMIGELPGGIGKTTNMYERICTTFQPPLYNFLMYFWLKIFDSEFGFRLAGIIVTLLGSVGIFKAIDEQTKDGIWSNAGALLYLFTSTVAYYGLECAEYNLMLCFLAWTVYFFVRVILRCDVKSLVGFFVFSCLAVYSQYGAGIAVLGMFIVLTVNLLREKNFYLIKKEILLSVITGVFVVLPLIVFFLIPQMNNQGSIEVSHSPVFVYNALIDYIWGILKCLYYFVYSKSLYPLGKLIYLGVLVSVLCTLLSLIIKKNRMLYILFGNMMLTWTIYFCIVSCSFYGYNSWNAESLGTNNIAMRYSLFLIPMVIVLLIIGVKEFLHIFKEKKHLYRAFVTLCAVGLTIFCGIEIIKLDFFGWNKNNIREVVQAWYTSEAYNSKTLVHNETNTTFYFYFLNNSLYKDEYAESVETTDRWILYADEQEMETKLIELGYLELEEFYYVTSISAYNESYEAFLEVMDKYGFDVKVLYEESDVEVFEYANSALLYLEKIVK